MLGYDWPRLHAALNDLPAALLLVAVLFELAGVVLRRPALRVAGFWTLVIGAVGGALAVVSGLQAEEHIAHGEAVHRAMETHERLALITLGIFAVVAIWRIVRETPDGRRRAGAVLASRSAGWRYCSRRRSYGGKLVFDHAAGIPTPVLEAECTSGRRAITITAARARRRGARITTTGAGRGRGSAAAPAGGIDGRLGQVRWAHAHARPGTPPHKD